MQTNQPIRITQKNDKGFTLIELSIVIVIIGLIVAGIVGGQAIVQQAKLRSIISDIEKFDTAYNTFKLEYNALPGDMRNASSYWTGIPDGDGNKQIVTSSNSGNSHNGEYWWFWVHLGQNASGLLPGQYTHAGVNTALPESDRDVLLPKSRLENHWGVYNKRTLKAHRYVLGITDTTWGTYWAEATLTPKGMYSIDKKMDDGMPGTGVVSAEGRQGGNNWIAVYNVDWIYDTHYAQAPTSGNCTANGAASYDETAQYNLAFGDEVSCIALFNSR